MLARYFLRRAIIRRLTPTIPQRASAYSAARADFMRAAFAARASRYLAVLAC